jgi:pimeloyl-ACP methyl ester carboxylesterase
VRDDVLTEVLKTPRQVMGSAMENMFNLQQPAWDPRNITVPVIVLNAPNPRWTSEYEQWVRVLSPRTAYTVLDDVHHTLMLEKPAEFNQVLVSRLQEFDLMEK